MKEEIKKFIIKEIQKLSEKFPHVSFKYGFDKLGAQHLIEVEPETAYKTEEYMDAEFDIVDQFICKFPEDEILFISNNKYIKIEKVVYVKESKILVKQNALGFAEICAANDMIFAPLNLIGYAIGSPMNEINIVNPLIKNPNNNNFTLNNSQLVLGDPNLAMAA